MDSHSFCRMLLRTARQDAKDKGIDVRGLSVTKPSLGGYEVEGPRDRYSYFYTWSACCAYCAKAEAIDALIERSAADLICRL